MVNKHAAGSAELIPFSQILSLLSKQLNSFIGAIPDKNSASTINQNRMRHIKLTRPAALTAPFQEVPAGRIKFNDPIVPVTISHEKASVFCLRHISRAVKSVGTVAGESPGAQTQQNIACGIDFCNRVARLTLIIGRPDIALRRQTKAMRTGYPLRTAKGIYQVAFRIELQHRRI